MHATIILKPTLDPMESFKKPQIWDDLVAKVSTLEIFKGVAKGVFEDVFVIPQRLMVLELFARDVGKVHPTISREVWRHYGWVWDTSENRYKKLCWLYSKYDASSLIKDVRVLVLWMIILVLGISPNDGKHCIERNSNEFSRK